MLGARLTCTATARAVSRTRRRHNTPSSLHRAISARAPTCAAFLRRVASWLSMVAHDQRSCRDPWAQIADECWAECDPLFRSDVTSKKAVRDLGHRYATLRFTANREAAECLASHLHRCGVRIPSVGSVPFRSCAYSHGGDRVNTMAVARARGSAEQRARIAGRLSIAAGSAFSAAQYSGWLGFRRGSA